MSLVLIPFAEHGDWPYPEVTMVRAIAIDLARGLVAIAWTETRARALHLAP